MASLLLNDDTRNGIDENPTVFNVAHYFINKAHSTPPYNITHLKLQKLVYYALGWYSVIKKGEQLFDDKIQAWKYGPVSPVLYNRYKHYGADPLPNVIPDDNALSPFQQRVLDSVWNVYGKFNSIELMERTHLEEPWLKNYDPKDPAKDISFEDIRDYFNKLK